MTEQQSKDLALSALVLLAQFHRIPVNSSQIKHQFDTQGQGLSETQWLLAAKSLGFKTKTVSKTVDRLPFLNLPALVWRDDGKHFILVKVDKDEGYLIQDLELERLVALSSQEFSERYQDRIILLTSRASVLGALAKFDFTWFIPAIVKYRRILLEVVGVSIILQIFALITPLFFQVVMDKVLVHQGFSTLNVIAVALAVVVIFEVILGGVRTYIFAHTTSRIDVELGARLFRHLLALPIAYFENRRVGDTVARVRE